MTDDFKPFYETVDFLYDSVVQNLPEKMQEMSEVTAFFLGAAGTYVLTRGLQWTSKNLVEPYIPNFDKKALPVLEKITMGLISGLPIVYEFFVPGTIGTIMSEHTTYTSGMAGVWVGGNVAAAQDLDKRERQKLEKIIEDNNS